MRIPKWRVAMVAIGVVGVLLAVPIAVSAVAQTFSDVPPTDWAYNDIEWLAANGLTNGCTSDGTEYCPENPVTRREMAAFTHRLATSRVVEAKTATDADLLDGKDSTSFVRKGEANSVSPSMLAASPGVAQTTDFNFTDLTSTPSTITSVNVKAPAAGYVLVQSTFDLRAIHTNGTEDLCQVDVSAVDAAMPGDITPHVLVPSSTPSSEHRFMSAASRVYPVADGGSHTFYLVGREVSGRCRVINTVLTALYVPVAYGDT